MLKTIDFMSQVYPEPNTGCWLWAGGLTKGYGQLNPKSHNGFQYAHRYSYFLHHGEFDRTKLLCHTCDVPACVNPDHLYLGTHKDNTRDIIERGNPNYAIGTKNGQSKLNPNSVIKIREEFRNGNISKRALGVKYGVSHTTINDVIIGVNWSHVF
jgi:hypothetical protein